eukprot:TRINITY_DN1125_c0_g3_i2.p2 TRINITY_DN1125_c0_g3~~TRINITY_DN1125_c0_g3_i2.p2  ORF type:complete len:156 (+),score=62.47 TRINITY_DN1125_c0_g3_i2:103-570(+)
MDQTPEVLAARAKLKARMGDSVRTGGEGSARRTKKKAPSNRAADDKQLQAQFKRLGVNSIPGIEEVNMFKEDGSVLHFSTPKVQANVSSNTYIITGNGEQKSLEELLPGIINQLGPDNLMNLKRIAEGFAAGKGAKAEEGGDDDIPEVEGFDDKQ